MVVAYHSSDAYAYVTGVSIASLFEHNQDADDITVYVIERKISMSNKEKMSDTAHQYGRNLVFIPMPDINRTEGLHLKMIRKTWLFDSYCRIFLDKLLPESVDRVLYLDGDTLVTDSLKELWKWDLGENCAGAVMDCIGEDYYRILGLDGNARYCNSGVILFDLKAWRQRKLSDKIRDYVHARNGYVFFMEQSVFNAVANDQIAILPARYNVTTMMQTLDYEEMKRLRKIERFYSREEVLAAVRNPAVLHLTSFFFVVNRAWVERNTHPAAPLFLKQKQMTPWADEPLMKDRRGLGKKIIDGFIHCLPRRIVLFIASWLYNVARVRKVQFDQKNYARQKE